MSLIQPADFIKWKQVFKLVSGGITPGDISLQLAYNGGKTINMAAASPIAINSSLGTQVMLISDKGTQSHLPIYLLSGSNLDLTADLIDSVFQNKDSEVDNVITLKSDIDYAQCAYFRVMSFVKDITVVAESGVILDDDDAGSRTSLSGQVWDFYQLSDKSWASINIKPTADNGIIYGDDGVLELDGSGASNGYGYLSIVGSGADVGTETPTSFPALNRYLIPWSVNTILVDDTNNFSSVVSNPTPDVPCLAGIKYVGEEPGVVEVTFLASFRYATSNTNPGSTDYFLSANLNLTGDGSGAFVPINPISVSGAYNSGSDIPFIIYPNYITSPTAYTFQIAVNPGDEIYPAVRSATSTSAPDNAFVINRLIIAAKKIGDIGGATAGVTSLGGATGNIGLSNSLKMDGDTLDIDLVPIEQGGTNTDTQASRGVTFYDDSKITSTLNFTYQGVDLILSNPDSSQRIIIQRKDDTEEAQIWFRDVAETNFWQMGIGSFDSLFRVKSPSGNDSIVLDPSGVIYIPSVSGAGTRLATAATNGQIGTGDLSGDVSSSGLVTTLATVNASPNTYGSATQVPVFTVNGKGLVTSVTNTTITGTTPGGSAGGDLTGTYPDPTIASNAVSNAKFRQSVALSVVGNSTNATANVADISAASDNQILRRSGTAIGFGSIDLSQSNAVGSSVLGQSNGGTNATSYGASRVIFQNSGNTAFSSAAALTFNGADTLTLTSGNTSTEIISKSSNSGAGAEARMTIDRNGGGGTAGYAQLRYSTNGTAVWEVGMRDGTDSYSVRNGSNRLTVTSGGDVTANTGNLIIGTTGKTLNFPTFDADKILFFSDTAATKIDTTSGFNFNFRSGSTATPNSGVFNWMTSGSSVWTTRMTLSNTGALTLANNGTVTAPTGTTQLNIASTVQNSARITLSGQEFYQAANTSTEGVCLLLGVNRSGDRQMWMASSAGLTQNSTNRTIRFLTNSGTIDSMATDGTTALSLTLGQTGSATTINGSSTTIAGGAVSVTGGDFDTTRSSTSEIINKLSNTNNANSAAHAKFQAITGGASGGDPKQVFTISSVQDWCAGVDNSASDQYVIAASDTPGSSDRLQITTGGDITVVSGNLSINTVNKGLSIKGVAVSGGTANGAFVTNVVLTGGASGTINNSFVTTACVGAPSISAAGGTPGLGYAVTCNNGSFSVASTNALDASTLNVVFFKGI